MRKMIGTLLIVVSCAAFGLAACSTRGSHVYSTTQPPNDGGGGGGGGGY